MIIDEFNQSSKQPQMIMPNFTPFIQYPNNQNYPFSSMHNNPYQKIQNNPFQNFQNNQNFNQPYQADKKNIRISSLNSMKSAISSK